jgi:hypothetical protein
MQIERENVLKHYLMEGPIAVLTRNPNNFHMQPLDVEKEYSFSAFAM